MNATDLISFAEVLGTGIYSASGDPIRIEIECRCSFSKAYYAACHHAIAFIELVQEESQEIDPKNRLFSSNQRRFDYVVGLLQNCPDNRTLARAGKAIDELKAWRVEADYRVAGGLPVDHSLRKLGGTRVSEAVVLAKRVVSWLDDFRNESGFPDNVLNDLLNARVIHKARKSGNP